MNDLKKARRKLDKNSYCREIKKVILREYSQEKAEEIWEYAARELCSMHSRFSELPKQVKMHTNGIFVQAAVYFALKSADSEKAMEIVAEGASICSKKRAGFFKTMVKLPFGRTLFLKGFAFGSKKMFGEKAGFKQNILKADGNVFEMDILQCPYVHYCNALGCPELAHIFCDNDVYVYGSLNGIDFIRTQTLGAGGEKCDFRIYKK